MKRAAFSLVELIISIFLLGIIVVFLYSTVSNLQKTNEIFAKNEKELSKSDKLLDLIYDDIFLSDEFNATGKEYSLVNLKTRNSIFDISQPNVSWLVSREKNTLLRFESVLPFKDISSDNTNYYHISKIGENCEVFHIYQSLKKDNILVHIKFKGENPIIYEFSKPLKIKKVKKKKKSPHKKNNHKIKVTKGSQTH